MAKYDEGQHKEIPDPRPVSVPVGFRRPLTLQEEIKRFVRQELSQRAATVELETFEEADDFDVDEDPELRSPYEIPEAAPEWPGGIKDADADPPGDPRNGPGGPNGPETGPNDPPGTKSDPGGSVGLSEASKAKGQVGKP